MTKLNDTVCSVKMKKIQRCKVQVASCEVPNEVLVVQ